MRAFINIVEHTDILTVYHGGPNKVVYPRVPFYVTPSLEMAKSYGEVISSFKLDLSKGRECNEQLARDEADIMGLEGAYTEPFYVLLKDSEFCRRITEDGQYIEFMDSPQDGEHGDEAFVAYCILDRDFRGLTPIVD